MSEATLVVGVDGRKAIGDIKKVDKSLKGLDKTSRKVNDELSRFAKIGIAAGFAALGTAIVKSTQIAIAFEKSMAEVSTLVDTSTVNMDALAESVKGVNAQFGGGLTEQAKALYGIISAGAEAGAESTDILTQANILAIGGVADLETAASGLSSVMNAYAASGLTATDASDSLFIAVREGVTTISELSTSLGKVSSIAQASGVTFDELNASIATLTAGGINTAESVTGLKAALSGMVGASAEGAKIAEELGIEMGQADIKSRGLAAVLQEIRDKTEGNVGTMKKLLGSMEAVNSVLILTDENGKKLNETLAAMDEKAGAAALAHEKMSNTISAQWAILVGNIENAGETIGKILTPAILDALRQVNALASAFNKFFDQFSDKTKLEGALVGIEIQVANTSLQLLELSNAGLQSSQRFKDLNVDLFQFIAKARVLQKDLGITANELGNVEDETKGLIKPTKTLTKEVDKLADTLDVATDELEAFGGAGKEIYTWVDSNTEAMNSFTDSLLDAQVEFEQIGEKQAIVKQLMDEGRISAEVYKTAMASLGQAGGAAAGVMTLAFSTFIEQTQTAFGDLINNGFQQVLRDGENAWKAFTDTVLDMAIRMVANVMAEFALIKLAGAFGFSSAGGSGGTGGMAAMQAAASAAGGAIKTYVSGLFAAEAGTAALAAESGVVVTKMGTMAYASESSAFAAQQLAAAQAEAAVAAGELSGASSAAGSSVAGLGVLAVVAIGGMMQQAKNAREAAAITEEVGTKFAEAAIKIDNSSIAFGTWGTEGLVQLGAAAEKTAIFDDALEGLGVNFERGAAGAILIKDNVELAEQAAGIYSETVNAALSSQIVYQQTINGTLYEADELYAQNQQSIKDITAEWGKSVKIINDTNFDKVATEIEALYGVASDNFAHMSEDGILTANEINLAFGDASAGIIKSMGGAESVTVKKFLEILAKGELSSEGLIAAFDELGISMASGIADAVADSQASINSLKGVDITNTVTTQFNTRSAEFATGTPEAGFTVPDGFPNDTFGIGVSSREVVHVDTPAQNSRRNRDKPESSPQVVDNTELVNLLTINNQLLVQQVAAAESAARSADRTSLRAA